MKATILDTVTGERMTVDGPPSWEWAENNWSCDCNRNPWGVETGNHKRGCNGCERFLVVEAVMDDPQDYEDYTLEELNAGYPKELLARFIGRQVNSPLASPSCSALWRDDGEMFSRNDDGTYSMGNSMMAEPYRYTFGVLMDTGAFSVYPPNAKDVAAAEPVSQPNQTASSPSQRSAC